MRYFRSGHFHGFQRIQIYFPLNHSLPIWIICFGESPRIWRIIILHGFSSIYGKEETIKCLIIWIWTREILSNWQKHNCYFRRKHKTPLTQGMDHIRVHGSSLISNIPGRWCFTDGSWKKSGFIFRTRMI